MPNTSKILTALYGTLTTSQIAKAARYADTTPQMVEHVLCDLRRGCSPEHSHHPDHRDETACTEADRCGVCAYCARNTHLEGSCSFDHDHAANPSDCLVHD